MKRSQAAGELRPYVVGWLGQQARLEPAGDLTLAPTGRVVLAPGARAVEPETALTTSLGSAGKPFLAVHAAELNVASLVAREVISTIGGRIPVGPTTTLTANLAPAETTIWTRHNELAFGDIVLLEAHGQIEYMRVIGGPSGSGPYTYSVQRNLDGSGANTWYSGDAVFNTGQINDGFIDIYSEHGTLSSDQAGPTIAGNVRNSTTWNDYETRWAIGNLRGLYGYTEDVYGQASGRHSAVWQATDPTNGFRIMHGATRSFAVSPDGVARLGLEGQGEIEIDPVSGALSFLSEGEVVSAILGRERTIYGFERLGRPLGPCVEWGPLEDPDGDEQLERWGFWLRAQEGERFLAAVSGTETNPDDAYFRVGRDAAAHFLQLKDGLLSWAGANTSLGEDGTFTARNAVLEGSITAQTGRIGGWNITSQAIYTGTEDHFGYTANAGDITLWSDGVNASIHGRYFYLGTDGTIRATGAIIDGQITAASGNIAGLTIADHTLTSSGLKLVIDEANERIRFGNIYISPTEGIKGVSFPSNLPIDTDALTVEAQAYFNSSLSHTGTYLGFFGATAVTRPSAYTFSNGASDKAIDCNATTVEELADVVYTMWNDLKNLGLLQ